jgi:hypothetical protein
MSASEAPATVMPATILILAISMTVMLPAGADRVSPADPGRLA